MRFNAPADETPCTIYPYIVNVKHGDVVETENIWPAQNPYAAGWAFAFIGWRTEPAGGGIKLACDFLQDKTFIVPSGVSLIPAYLEREATALLSANLFALWSPLRVLQWTGPGSDGEYYLMDPNTAANNNLKLNTVIL